MFICKVATEYTLTCGEGVPSPNNPQKVDDTMLTTSHIVPSVSIAIQRRLYLYDGSKGSIEANECKDITGGWSSEGFPSASWASREISKYNDHIQMGSPSIIPADQASELGTKNLIDLTNYKTLHMQVTKNDISMAILEITTNKSSTSWGNNVKYQVPNIGDLIMDISTFNGGYYILARNYKSIFEFDAIWLE